jgi:Tol biopolymer transport system component
LWVKTLRRGTTAHLTPLPGWNYWPVWPPDSKHIDYAWIGSTARGLYQILADGSGEPQQLTDNGLPYSHILFLLTATDGKRLTYEQISRHTHIWTVLVEAGGERGRASGPAWKT